MSGVNTFDIALPDLPEEWDPVDPALLEWMRPDDRGVSTPEQIAVEERVLASRFYLVKNTLAWRCRYCRQGTLAGAIHPYITVACQPRPFTGLNEVWAFMNKQYETGGYAAKDIYTMRLGEEIVPITVKKARELYATLQTKLGRDVEWEDFWVAFRRRYKTYLFIIGWDPEALTSAQWHTVQWNAREQFVQERR